MPSRPCFSFFSVSDAPPSDLRPEPLHLFSVIIPARDEAENLPSTLEALISTLTSAGVPHEIVVVDDGSQDATWRVLQDLKSTYPTLSPVQNPGPHGIGRAIVYGLDHMQGDACCIFMADASDAPADAVIYWHRLQQGWECVFGSRFVKGGSTHDYPWMKLKLNRAFNAFLKCLFGISLNDTTNAFKGYRRTVIDGCRPLIAPHFNLLVEIPLKAIVRGYRWTVVPISWHNRKHGESKLKIKEMGSRYLFITLYVWLEKFFSRGDYRRKE
jgi:dolichol-phosphate mannosyltransferase